MAHGLRHLVTCLGNDSAHQRRGWAERYDANRREPFCVEQTIGGKVKAEDEHFKCALNTPMHDDFNIELLSPIEIVYIADYTVRNGRRTTECELERSIRGWGNAET